MTTEERSECVYEVTISMPDPEGFGPPSGFPTESEVQMAIYRGIHDIDSEHAVEVVIA